MDPFFRGALVRVQAVILPSGEVTSISILRSSGYPSLDASSLQALSAMKCWFDAPATESIPVAQEFTFATTTR